LSIFSSTSGQVAETRREMKFYWAKLATAVACEAFIVSSESGCAFCHCADKSTQNGHDLDCYRLLFSRPIGTSRQ
jgi:hypothetical protein